MNYLAHAYLSFNETPILVGNMISDFVKGKKKFDYSPQIQSGITLHRAIDEFTDNHPATQSAKRFFKPAYRLYAGAFADVVYDHFLACDTDQFPSEAALFTFSQQVYETLENNLSVLPDSFKRMFPYMQTQNWLFNYQYKWGIEKSFGGLMHRARYITETATAYAVFNEHYDELEECYRQFFPEVKMFAAYQLRNLLHG